MSYKRFRTILPALLLLLSLCACQPQDGGTSAPPQDSSFAVHYIDVGQADAALVVCDGRYMLIDGGNAEDSDLIYAYLEAQGAGNLDYLVATHPHEDHIGGLSGALNYAGVDIALSPVEQWDSKVFQNMIKYLDLQDRTLTIPEPGDTFSLGSAQVEVLGPAAEYSDANDMSIVLRVDYGETSFLFTGDMESAAEQDLMDAGARLDATVLKVGHHGSDSSSGYAFLRQVMPEYAVISVGEGNSYGHPSQAVLSRLRDAEAQVYRTDLQGTIIARSDGDSVTFLTEKTSPAPTNPTRPREPGYVGNINSRKFHNPSCPSVPEILSDHRVSFDTREQAVSAGYEPCGRCSP